MSACRLGVIGWPVAHSRSPPMQNAALRAAGLAGWRYQLLPIPEALLAETVPALPALGFRGANVTIPHKQAALYLADHASEQAHAIGAANTLLFDRERIYADNTDATALIEALPFAAAGRTALVLGAGGTARAALWALLDAGAPEVRVWNRTAERARQLCAQIGGTPLAAVPSARTGPSSSPRGGRGAGPERDGRGEVDLVVNCTSAASLAQLPIVPDDLVGVGCVVDFVYRSGETELVAAARERSIPVVDGLSLLVGQGARSFELFTGLPAPVQVMREAVSG